MSSRCNSFIALNALKQAYTHRRFVVRVPLVYSFIELLTVLCKSGLIGSFFIDKQLKIIHVFLRYGANARPALANIVTVSTPGKAMLLKYFTLTKQRSLMSHFSPFTFVLIRIGSRFILSSGFNFYQYKQGTVIAFLYA